MPAPPARTEISDAYPNPTDGVARVGFGKLWDYVTGLLGMSGNAADARTALDVPSRGGAGAGGTWNINVLGSAAYLTCVNPIEKGGTGANTAAGARAALGLAAVASSGSAADLTSGTAPTARLGGGAANAGTFLRGDQQWVAPPTVGLAASRYVDTNTATLALGTVRVSDVSLEFTGGSIRAVVSRAIGTFVEPPGGGGE
jgi:hypothetical protein